MVALDKLHVVDLKQGFAGQDIHSIFSYEDIGDGNSFDLGGAFLEDVLPAWNDAQAVDITNTSLTVINLGDLGDNDFRSLTGGGTISGSGMLPLHDAVNFTMKPSSRAVRPGSKRLSGLVELYQTAGTIDNATYITLLNTLRDAIGDHISLDDTNFYAPCVIKRVKYEVPDSDPVRFAYRFPEIGETPVSSQFAGILINLHISHQVSRK